MKREDDVIDLGCVSAETKGPLEPIGDEVGGFNAVGLSDA